MLGDPLDIYNQVNALTMDDLEKSMERIGWEIDIDRPGEGEHELRFRKSSNMQLRGRGIGPSRHEAMREAAQRAIRAELGPKRCFELGLL